MKRRTIKTAFVSLAFMALFGIFGPGVAEAACGGCYCSPGSGSEGPYTCVELKGQWRYLRSVPNAN